MSKAQAHLDFGPFDLIVVGGGIYGAFVTLEATRAGLRPLLLERDRFGGATSDNSLQIIHGGIRYLQYCDLPRFRESVQEQAWFLHNLPHQVQLLSCLMPLYDRGLRRRSTLRAALALNDFAARRLDGGARRDGLIPPSAILGRARTIEHYPDVLAKGLRGGAHWFDLLMIDQRRLIQELVDRARQSGAICHEGIEALKLGTQGRKVERLHARRRSTQEELEFRAPVVVNCAGPHVRSLAGEFDRDVPELFSPALAFNLLIDRPPLSKFALAINPNRIEGATYFLVPVGDKILAGTQHLPWTGGMAAPTPTEDQIATFIQELNAAAPALQLRPHHVSDIRAGLLPARSSGSKNPASRPTVYVHGDHGGPDGLVSVSGVKYTTARAVAEKTLKRIGLLDR